MIHVIHAVFVICGFVMILTGLISARFLRKRRWWLKLHKMANTVGSLSVLTGFFIMVINKSITGAGHFDSIHAYVGFFIGLLSISTPVIGFIQLKAPYSGIKIRQIHGISGRILVILMAINILSGLRIAGIA
ncbi:MAG TPA: hypothetical protein PKW07_05440 [Syntrophorhabdaceae bacterium]|nr:hypothetical protein [Syntrophorhabdaceae bacterium]